MSQRIRLGTIVRDRKDDSETPGLVMKVDETPAEEYIVASGGEGGASISLADRNEEAPPDDEVAIVVFDPILRRGFPDWQERPMEVIGAYWQGSFRSAERPLPISRLERVDSEDGIPVE